MNWPSIEELSKRAPLPEGYRYELLGPSSDTGGSLPQLKLGIRE
jgi:hypothetical protein